MIVLRSIRASLCVTLDVPPAMIAAPLVRVVALAAIWKHMPETEPPVPFKAIGVMLLLTMTPAGHAVA